MTVSTAAATGWLQRWDRQQQSYIADREERFAVIADVVEATSEDGAPTVVDLGCGPGSLSVRLLDRIPRARVIGVDADPLLLGLAEAGYGHRRGLRFIDHDLRDADWTKQLDDTETPVDAVVSTTALHWLTTPELEFVYTTATGLLRPGGVLVNGDHLHPRPDEPTLNRLLRTVRHNRAQRAGGDSAEDWQAWWQEVSADPQLGPLVTSRSERAIAHHGEDETPYAGHVEILQKAGFREAGTAWQSGDDRVLVAVR